MARAQKDPGREYRVDKYRKREYMRSAFSSTQHGTVVFRLLVACFAVSAIALPTTLFLAGSFGDPARIAIIDATAVAVFALIDIVAAGVYALSRFQGRDERGDELVSWTGDVITYSFTQLGERGRFAYAADLGRSSVVFDSYATEYVITGDVRQAHAADSNGMPGFADMEPVPGGIVRVPAYFEHALGRDIASFLEYD